MQDSENKYSVNQVLDFIHWKTGSAEIREDSDLFANGFTGKSFTGLVRSFSQMFRVNADNYLWYFHTDEEGMNVGSVFFRPPFERVERIPVTPLMLTGFANKGFWDIDYPEHEIPARLDHLISILFFFAVAFLLIYVASKKF